MRAPHTGTVAVDVDGESVPLRFSWEALSAIHGEMGAGWQQKLSLITTSNDTRALAAFLAAASGRPAAWWMERSPPLVPAVNAVNEALEMAFFGPEGPPENPSKRPASGLSTILSRLLGGRGTRSGEAATSGS